MRPTPYADVNALLRALLSGLTTTLGPQLIGLYLHGSLAGGDFDPHRSDIDLLAVTAGELPTETLAAIEALHGRIAASDIAWRTNYEVSYIPQTALRRFDPEDASHPALRCDGSFGLDRHGPDWVIQRHILREQAITLAGPPPESLIDPISPDDLRRAVMGALEEWWAPQIDDPLRLRSSEYQAYAVLTMCRALYTLETGEVTSKPQAASWAQERLDERWSALIETALHWQHGVLW